MQIEKIRHELAARGLRPADLTRRLGMHRCVWADLRDLGPGRPGTQRHALAQEIARELGRNVEDLFPGKEAA